MLRPGFNLQRVPPTDELKRAFMFLPRSLRLSITKKASAEGINLETAFGSTDPNYLSLEQRQTATGIMQQFGAAFMIGAGS